MAKNDITYYWGDRSLLIKLGNRTNARIRALFIAEFILTSFIATVLLIKSLPFRHVFIDWAAGVGGMCLYLFAVPELFRFRCRIQRETAEAQAKVWEASYSRFLE